MTVKEFTPFDTEYVASAKEKGFSDAWNKKMLSDGLNSGRLFGFIAQENLKNVGFITFSVAVDTADIEDVFVEAEQRKKGIAKSLIEKAVETVKEKGAGKVFLEVRASNVPAVNLYSKCGFAKISVRKKYYSDGEDAIVMIKEL